MAMSTRLPSYMDIGAKMDFLHLCTCFHLSPNLKDDITDQISTSHCARTFHAHPTSFIDILPSDMSLKFLRYPIARSTCIRMRIYQFPLSDSGTVSVNENIVPHDSNANVASQLRSTIMGGGGGLTRFCRSLRQNRKSGSGIQRGKRVSPPPPIIMMY